MDEFKKLFFKSLIIIFTIAIIIKLIEPVVERQISKIFSDKKISNKIMKELVNSTDEFTPEKKEFYIDIIKKIYIKWIPLFNEAQNVMGNFQKSTN